MLRTKKAAEHCQAAFLRVGAAALFGREHHQHLAAFHAGILLNLGNVRHIFLHPLQQLHAQLAMRQFTTTKAQGDFHPIAFANEFLDLAHLHIIIMIIEVGTHFYPFDFLRFLGFPRGIGLFLGLKCSMS